MELKQEVKQEGSKQGLLREGLKAPGGLSRRGGAQAAETGSSLRASDYYEPSSQPRSHRPPPSILAREEPTS
jgi:hypothetical protein